MKLIRLLAIATLASLVLTKSTQAADLLPSWNDGRAKQAILDFVQLTTDKSSPKYMPTEARIATFDQDGTAWVDRFMKELD